MPPTQTYANHVHRPTPTALAGLFLLISIMGFVLRQLGAGGQWAVTMSMGGLVASVGVLISISRLYIVRLQDRIIRLEMRVRCAELLTPEQQRVLLGLDRSRIAALRFASDAELPALVERTARESLKPNDIKRAIKNWVPDFDRT
jgi:uncharacterized protein DUF6526